MNAAVMETHCPGPNEMAAFAEGKLGPEEHSVITAHLAECAECRDMVLTATEMMDAEAELPAPVPIRRSWRMPAVVFAAAAAIAVALFLSPARDRYTDWSNTRTLTRAVASLEKRPTPGRLSFETAYKVYPRMRGGANEVDPELDAMTAAAKLGERADRNPTIAHLTAAGRGYLLLANQEGDNWKEMGVEFLEKALAEQTSRTDIDDGITVSTDANLLNDLAAGYNAISNEDRARKAIERAWALDNRSLPIAWTRAEILQTRAGWEDYLKLDATSEWSNEARRNLDLP